MLFLYLYPLFGGLCQHTSQGQNNKRQNGKIIIKKVKTSTGKRHYTINIVNLENVTTIYDR